MGAGSFIYDCRMDYTTWLIVKFIVLVVAAFAWGVYCGATNRPLGPGKRDNQAGQHHPATANED
jgi:hypothetical protein